MDNRRVASELVRLAKILLADDVVKRRRIIVRAFPSGAYDGGSYLSWDKRGGYAGERAIGITLEKLKVLGFQKGKVIEDASPGTGETIVHGNVYHDSEGNEFSCYSSYGVTKAQNRFDMKMKFAPAYQSRLQKES